MPQVAEETQIQSTVELKTITCGECGGTYALSSRYLKERKARGGCWHCPYCQINWGYGESENDSLRKKIELRERSIKHYRDRANDAYEESEHHRRQRDSLKGVITKAKKRVSNGVCPCCNRYFANLHKHMKSKHPKFSAQKQKS